MTIATVAVQTRAARRDRYVGVNSLWPDPLPVLTEQEAVSAAKRLYRFGMGKPWSGPVRITSGRRYTWIHRGVFVVNPSKGWHDLVHDVSHLVHYHLHPDKAGHDSRHTYLEKTMVEQVLARGWLDGTLKKPEKPKPNVREVRYQHVLARIKNWESKRKRAETALKKLYKSKAYYEK